MVTADVAALRLGERDQVTLHGSLPQMGAWRENGGGVPMLRVPSSGPGVEDVWMVDLEVPFLANESCITGLWEYKFAVETPEGEIILEALTNRREKRMQPIYYASFRPPLKHPKFKSLKKAARTRPAVETFILHELTGMRRGML